MVLVSVVSPSENGRTAVVVSVMGYNRFVAPLR